MQNDLLIVLLAKVISIDVKWSVVYTQLSYIVFIRPTLEFIGEFKGY